MEALRIAVVSAPRSGNMWLRRLLVVLFRLEERSAHTPDEVEWEALPERCVLQLHWPRTRAFAKQLDRTGFRVVVLARHPLDILLSILQFAPHEPETARWLDGVHGDERAILGLDPLSDAFRVYAAGPRARALLDVTPDWWRRSAAALRYEDLVGDAPAELARIAAALEAEPAATPEEAAAAVTFGGLAAEARNAHFWQGRPGHWRELLPADVAVELAAPYRKLVKRFGYAVDPDPALTHEEARLRWLAKIAETRV
ncbi:MAG TPA: hypothetical protein VFA82_09840 [Gaiellaceae bacterium]|nr:hypothetical protein [Gaiellaceae bacterium]